MTTTREAWLRFARVLVRRGDPAGDAYVRAAAVIDGAPSSTAEEHLRELIEALAEREEHDVLDALRPEAERSLRVGAAYAEALGRRGSLVALDSFVRANCHCWEHANRVDGALARVVMRGAEGVALIRGWLTLPAHGTDPTSHRAYTWVQQRQAQALAWLGATDDAKALSERTRADMDSKDEHVAMWGCTLRGPVLAAMGDPVTGRMVLSLGRQYWDRIYDDDVDGYGSLFADFLTSAEERLEHLSEQRWLGLDKRTWEQPPSKRPHAPSRGWYSMSREYDELEVKRLLEVRDVAAAIELARSRTDEVTRASLFELIANALPTAAGDGLDGALELLRGLYDSFPDGNALRSMNWKASVAEDLAGALARSGRDDAAFALAASVHGGNLTDKAHAYLACAEAVLSARRTHPAMRSGLMWTIGEMSKHQASGTEVFSTPRSFAELLLTLL
ncbi:MAG: hypothetical protein QM817_04455 [Archangium sp.]